VAGWLAKRVDSEGQPLPGETPEATVTGHPAS
jgi:hypothetical protein